MTRSANEKPALLQKRLQEIAQSLKTNPDGIGLLGLGSAGKDLYRMDEYSDLDFFAIVTPGHKQLFINDLSWLSQKQSIAWQFRNTVDGYKVFYSDGVFCEFAVFEPQELAQIPYSEGRFIYRDTCLSEVLASPQVRLPKHQQEEDFLLGELLTNLYVGLCRYQRGEKMSAMRFIQVYAVDRLISLLDSSHLDVCNVDDVNSVDAFCLERRVEERHPQFRDVLYQLH